LFPEKQLSNETQEKIHHLSGGNIGIIMRLVEVIANDGMTLVENSDIYRDVTLQKMKITLNETRYNYAVNLLDCAALIGEIACKRLLSLFTDYEIMIFSDSIADAEQNEVLADSVDTVNFNNRLVWSAFYAANCKNRHFHYKLANSIKEIMPSNFSYIADELLYAGQEKEAAIYYILSALHYFKTYMKAPQLFSKQIELMQKCNVFDYYNRLSNLYADYFARSYASVRNIRIDFPDSRLAFEADFVRSLALINGSIRQTDYQTALTTLGSWIEDTKFQTNSPFQWMRAALLALCVQYELHPETMSSLLKKLEQIKRQYIVYDKGVEWLEYDFLAKCNYCYTIDTAYHYTKQAVEYFKRNMGQSPSMYPYYTSLINAAANALVYGDYQETIKFSIDALGLVQNGCFLYGALDVLFNNLYIATILNRQITDYAEYKNIISQLTLLSEATNEDNISKILLRNNLAVMYCYQGEFTKSFEKIHQLYEELQYADDIDDYYLYVIGSNYCLLAYMLEQGEFNHDLFSKICNLIPLAHDISYFTARNKYILSEINENRKIDISSMDWNDFSITRVGPAWSFWGKWLLFSDIQLWSD
jgi:hypothetical protein